MNELPYALWDAKADGALVASRHRQSKEMVFPAVVSDSPLASQYETVPIDRIGELYSFTVIHPSPKSGEAPYALGYVDFPGPLRIFGRLTGSARPVIGERYTPRPDERFGYVFETVRR